MATLLHAGRAAPVDFEGEIFGTIGVNVDIIKASWTALVEAYQYVLMQHAEFVGEVSDAKPANTETDENQSARS